MGKPFLAIGLNQKLIITSRRHRVMSDIAV